MGTPILATQVRNLGVVAVSLEIQSGEVCIDSDSTNLVRSKLALDGRLA